MAERRAGARCTSPAAPPPRTAARSRRADDPEAKLREIEERLDRLGSPFRTAEATGQDIIDPRDTRPLLADFVEDAQRVLALQLGPPPLLYLP